MSLPCWFSVGWDPRPPDRAIRSSPARPSWCWRRHDSSENQRRRKQAGSSAGCPGRFERLGSIVQRYRGFAKRHLEGTKEAYCRTVCCGSGVSAAAPVVRKGLEKRHPGSSSSITLSSSRLVAEATLSPAEIVGAALSCNLELVDNISGNKIVNRAARGCIGLEQRNPRARSPWMPLSSESLMFLARELLQVLHAPGATAVPALGRGMLLFAPSAPVRLAQTWVPLLEFLHLPEPRTLQSDDRGACAKIIIPDKECLAECRLSPISSSV